FAEVLSDRSAIARALLTWRLENLGTRALETSVSGFSSLRYTRLKGDTFPTWDQLLRADMRLWFEANGPYKDAIDALGWAVLYPDSLRSSKKARLRFDDLPTLTQQRIWLLAALNGKEPNGRTLLEELQREIEAELARLRVVERLLDGK